MHSIVPRRQILTLRGVITVRVLVTGAAGFIGSAVVDALHAAGHEVRRLVRRPDPAPTAYTTLLDDVRNREGMRRAVENVDAICHLAGLTRIRESFLEPELYWRTNVGGTLKVLGAALESARRRQHPIKSVIISSSAVYGIPTANPIAESTPREPTSPYGANKLATELASRDFAATGLIGAICLRAVNVAGAARGRPDRDLSRLVPRLMDCRTDAPIAVGSCRSVREYLHVEDLANAVVLAVDAAQPGRWSAYNVGTGRGSTVLDVIEAAQRVTGRRYPVEQNVDTDLKPTVLVLDSSRIRGELSWDSPRSNLETIIRDAWEASSARPRHPEQSAETALRPEPHRWSAALQPNLPRGEEA
jgi:UDP-glucose 4-epimerase